VTKRRWGTTTKLARPSRLFAVLVLVLCYVAPVQLGSQSKQIGPAQESAAGSHARPPADTKGWSSSRLGEPMLRDPVWVYNNWSSYDELSDNIPLTEALAMKELDEIARLRKFGIHFDYYMMDAFWFALDGGYREWRTPNWPNGPDRWIAQCKANGVLPGMWFGTNEWTCCFFQIGADGPKEYICTTTFFMWGEPPSFRTEFRALLTALTRRRPDSGPARKMYLMRMSITA